MNDFLSEMVEQTITDLEHAGMLEVGTAPLSPLLSPPHTPTPTNHTYQPPTTLN